MSATGDQHVTARNNTSRSPSFVRSARSIGVACTLSLGLLASTAAALDLTDIAPAQQVDETFKIDPKKCDVTQALVERWIGNNALTIALNKAFKQITDDFSGLTDDKFGHAKSKNISSIKAEALELLNSQRTALFNMSAKVTANLIEACDSCLLLDTWGKIRFIATVTRSDKFGVNKIADLTQVQMGNLPLNKELNDFIALFYLKTTDYPPNADSSMQTDLDNQCRAQVVSNLNSLSKIDVTKCNSTYLGKILEVSRKKIAKLLDDTYKPTDPKVSALVALECRAPGGVATYQYMSFATMPLP